MTFYLAGLNPFLLFALIFLTISIISICTLIFVHKFFHTIENKLNASRFIVPFFTINGAILGFLLAMVLVETWKNYQDEKENITTEMSNYLNIYRNARGLEHSDCILAQNFVRQIIKTTIEISWPEMENGGNGTAVSKIINDFQLYVLKLKTKNVEEEDTRKILLETLIKASELRRHRLLKSSQNIVPEPMWIIIFCCIFISVFSGFFFVIKPIQIHIILTLLQCAMISFVLFLIITFMYPYRGPMKIGPQDFERLLYKSIPNVDKS
ncbi:hypothetical protein Pnuc_0538 [Sporocytophaga myxococcoides]|uniref:DUF4239 domain-containing protein n=1 Tax=Sporocytophaga myxococcoides TaxID=153721 RepID=A0A098LLX4_9BACT|nr:DUF4239 domain-containing protein [Sporocytophaga myxococcoides]GAL87148.1 hypothetical protein Pnuc_0538 [Sporocytophaga myxococcoides]